MIYLKKGAHSQTLQANMPLSCSNSVATHSRHNKRRHILIGTIQLCEFASKGIARSLRSTTHTFDFPLLSYFRLDVRNGSWQTPSPSVSILASRRQLQQANVLWQEVLGGVDVNLAEGVWDTVMPPDAVRSNAKIGLRDSEIMFLFVTLTNLIPHYSGQNLRSIWRCSCATMCMSLAWIRRDSQKSLELNLGSTTRLWVMQTASVFSAIRASRCGPIQ